MSGRGHESSPLRDVGALARAVASRARQAHSARALCGGIAAAALVLACVVHRGGAVEDPEALVLSVVVGALSFFAWRASRSVATDTIARRVDSELGLRGAFVAAYEADRRRERSPLAELGAARLAAGLRRRDAMEAAIPHTVGFVALPMAALTGLILAVAARDAAVRSAEDAALRSLTLSAGLESLANEGSAPIDELQRDQIEQAARAAAAAARMPEDRREQEMRDVAAELDQLAQEVPPGTELAEALARAAAEAEAVALDIGGDDDDGGEPAPADDPGDDRSEPPGEEAEPGAGAETGSEGGPEGGAPTTGDGPAASMTTADSESVGTDAGGGPEVPGAVPTEAADRPDDPPATSTDAATRAAAGLRWWSDRDDSIVSRWVARSRGDAGR